MKYAGKCLINGIWRLLQGLQVSEICNIKTCKSCLCLSNKWFSLVKRLLSLPNKFLDLSFDFITGYSFSLSFFIFNFDFSLLASYNCSLFISTFLFGFDFNRHYFQILLELSNNFSSLSEFENTRIISIKRFGKITLLLSEHDLE